MITVPITVVRVLPGAAAPDALPLELVDRGRSAFVVRPRAAAQRTARAVGRV